MPGKERYTVKQVATALTKSGGFVTHAAKQLGCNYTTVAHYIERHAELRTLCEDIKESHLDFAETTLLKKIKDGDLVATIFYLKCKGKERGYMERQEFTGEFHVHEKRIARWIKNVEFVPTRGLKQEDEVVH